MQLAGYLRVSTEGQVDAYGKDVQREGILRWAEINGHEVVQWFEEDGVSGTKDSGDRPALLDAMRSGLPGIVMFDATRIARRSIVQETLLNVLWDAGLRVFSSTAGELAADEDDPTKILVRQILAIIAEFDHRTTVKKLQSARVIKSAQGGYIGGVPAFGSTIEGVGKNAKFVPHPVESKVVERIRELWTEGESLRGIAFRLNQECLTTKMGKEWSATQVSRVIRRLEKE